MLLLSQVSTGVRPSDLIQIGPKPAMIQLSGTTPQSAKAIAATNEPLGMFKLRELPNIGHYASWAVTYDQDLESPVGVPDKLLNFSKMEVVLPQNVSENVTNDNTEIIYL